MKDMKNMNKKIIAGAALAVVGVTALLGVTHSKYTNKVTGNGETEIAKWYFKVNNQTQTMATIKLADTYNQATLIDGRIAPGTSGSFDLVIDTTGTEVGVKYDVDFKNETNKPTNLKFKHGSDSFDTIEDLEQFLTDTINANDSNADKVKTLTITWEWPYESGNDTVDTNEGLAALDYSFDIVVTGTQVVPQN